MSIKERDMLRDNIQFSVEEVWDLKDRDDLKEDCIDYILDKCPDSRAYKIHHHDMLELIIKFLLSKVCQCPSNKDLEKMAEIYDKQEPSIEEDILESITGLGYIVDEN